MTFTTLVIALIATNILMGFGYYFVLRQRCPEYPIPKAKILSGGFAISMFSLTMIISI